LVAKLKIADEKAREAEFSVTMMQNEIQTANKRLQSMQELSLMENTPASISQIRSNMLHLQQENIQLHDQIIVVTRQADELRASKERLSDEIMRLRASPKKSVWSYLLWYLSYLLWEQPLAPKRKQQHSRLIGRGTFIFEDGRCYEGSFKDDSIDGNVVYTLMYSDMSTGYGTMTWPNGAKYTGVLLSELSDQTNASRHVCKQQATWQRSTSISGWIQFYRRVRRRTEAWIRHGDESRRSKTCWLLCRQ